MAQACLLTDPDIYSFSVPYKNKKPKVYTVMLNNEWWVQHLEIFQIFNEYNLN